MKRVIALLLTAVMVVGLLGGCVIEEETAYVPTGDALVLEGQDPDSVNPTVEAEPQEFSLVYYPEKSLNPLLCNDYTNRVLLSLVYQGLFTVDSDFEAHPMLCESFRVSASTKTWTIYLNTEAVFSDGSRLTVEDVLASYEAAKSSKYYGGRFTHISSIEPTDDGGIAFLLDTPMEDLPLLLDIPIVKAEDVEAEHPRGTGPYVFEQNLAGAQLRRLQNWWCDATPAATTDSIPLVEAQSPSQIRDEFEFNDVGLVCADPYAHDYADFRGDFELWQVDTGVFLFLAVNVNYSNNEVFLNPDLRAALTYAINREYLIEKYYHGFAQSATLAASPSSPWYSQTLAANYEYDPVQFISELTSFGVVKETLRLLVNKDDIVRLRVARAIAGMLTELGVPTETLEMDTYGYNSHINRGDYDLYLGQTRLSANMDLSPFFARWGNLSYNGITNMELYDLCLDALENHGNYYDLLKAVAEDGRIVPILFSSHTVFASRGLLSDLAPSRDNVFFYTRGRTMADAKLETIYDE